MTTDSTQWPFHPPSHCTTLLNPMVQGTGQKEYLNTVRTIHRFDSKLRVFGQLKPTLTHTLSPSLAPTNFFLLDSELILRRSYFLLSCNVRLRYESYPMWTVRFVFQPYWPRLILSPVLFLYSNPSMVFRSIVSWFCGLPLLLIHAHDI